MITRDMGYIGVMVDDLVTKGTDEPYRMMTSRSEFRLLLRQDNADLRLTELSWQRGLASDRRMKLMEEKRSGTENLRQTLKGCRLPASPERDQWLEEHGQPVTRDTLTAEDLLRRPEIDLEALKALCPGIDDFSDDVRVQAELGVKYEGYLQKQRAQVARARAMEDWFIPEDTDYEQIESLRIEARQKLQLKRPQSLSQAGRIPGVNPADVAVLMVWLKKKRDEPGDVHHAAIQDGVVRHATAGDGHVTIGIDGGITCHATRMDVHRAPVFDGGTVRHATAGDGHVSKGIDGGVTRHAATGDVHRIILQYDSGTDLSA